MTSKLLYFLIPVLIAGCQPTDKSAVPKAPAYAASASGPKVTQGVIETQLEGIELRGLKDLEQQLRDIDSLGIEPAARQIAKVDEWLYTPDDEKAARSRIDNEVEKLRSRIETEVGGLTKAAFEAANGKIAAEKMTKINALLAFYPAPGDDPQRKKLEQLTSRVLSASRRVEDIRRLRYNEWAITRIQGSLKAYRYQRKVKDFSDLSKLLTPDRDALINNCVSWMSPVDPTFLEPSVMDLYSHVFGLTRDAMGEDDESRIKLTQGFVNSKNVRLVPADF